MGEDLIDPDRAVAEAIAEAGADDFGDAPFDGPFRLFVEALNATPLNAAGRAGARANVHRRLVNRLRLYADLARHPAIAEEDVDDPIVILGLARTGTTALQRMLSVIDENLSLETWKIVNPLPFPEPDDPAGRIAVAEQMETFLRTQHPAYFAAHPTIATQAEEDAGLHDLHFQHVLNHVYAPLPDYLGYLRSLPRDETYRSAKRVIQHLQWQAGGKRGRRWILKSPGHLGYVDAILAQHPRVTFIYSRRELEAVLPSYCRLIECFQAMSSDQVDRLAIGRMALDFWSSELRAYREAVARLDRRVPILTVDYREMVGDPEATIARLYAAAGLAFTPAARGAVRGWIAANPPGRFGTNRYSLGDYGLDNAMVAAAMGSTEDR